MADSRLRVWIRQSARRGAWLVSSQTFPVFVSNVSEHSAAFCSTVQHTATHCNTLQHATTRYKTLQHTGRMAGVVANIHFHEQRQTLQHTVAHGSTLQQLRNTPQHIATHLHCCKEGVVFPTQELLYLRCNTLQHTATLCNTLHTLQHTATHCNTLQHTYIIPRIVL